MNRSSIALAAVVALALAAPAFGQTESPSPQAAPTSPPAKPAIADADRNFVRQAAIAGAAQVEAGRLAIDRAASEQVKTFACAMVDDHSAANETLARIARRIGIALPKSTDKAHQAERQKLAGLKGADFERAYVDAQLADRRRALALFERQAKIGRDPELRRFAADMLPKLRGHLTMAENLATPLKTSGVAPHDADLAAHPAAEGRADDA